MNTRFFDADAVRWTGNKPAACKTIMHTHSGNSAACGGKTAQAGLLSNRDDITTRKLDS